MVCCAVVGLMFAGLDARGESSVVKKDNWEGRFTLVVFLRRFIYDRAVFQTS